MNKPTVIVVSNEASREEVRKAVDEQLEQLLDDPSLHAFTVSAQPGKVGGVVIEILAHVVHPKVEQVPGQRVVRPLGGL